MAFLMARSSQVKNRPSPARRKGPGRRPLTVLLMLLFLAFAVPSETVPVKTESLPDREYRVKAVFLYNFAQFVQWPQGSFPDSGSPLVVGVLGSDPFNFYLDEVVKGEQVGGHPIKVVRHEKIEDVKDCHVLFVSASETQRLAPILSSLKARKILTVGESDLFSRMGGMVSFVTRQGKIRLKVNLEAVQAADLTLSAKLLRLAEIVPPGKG